MYRGTQFRSVYCCSSDLCSRIALTVASDNGGGMCFSTGELATIYPNRLAQDVVAAARYHYMRHNARKTDNWYRPYDKEWLIPRLPGSNRPTLRGCWWRRKRQSSGGLRHMRTANQPTYRDWAVSCEVCRCDSDMLLHISGHWCGGAAILNLRGADHVVLSSICFTGPRQSWCCVLSFVLKYVVRYFAREPSLGYQLSAIGVLRCLSCNGIRPNLEQKRRVDAVCVGRQASRPERKPLEQSPSTLAIMMGTRSVDQQWC